MTTPKDHFHGSDLEKIEQVYGIKKEDIISFSSNVNPLGISPKLRESLAHHIDAISTYPDREYTSLRQSIASYCGTKREHIIVGNGSTELISLFIQTQKPGKALMVAPTYSEYEREITLTGGQIEYYELKECNKFTLNIQDLSKQLDESIDMLIICNPNNPTSSCITNKTMKQILDLCKIHHIFVMIDETYVEFVDNVADITSVPLTHDYDNLAILRGTSKFFAAPGLRLGYAITGNQDLIAQINTRRNPWTINSLAAIAGEIMFSDSDYIENTRSLINQERNRLYQLFAQGPEFVPYTPSANFMLLKICTPGITSSEIFDCAIRQNLMIRDCSSFPYLNNRFIRFCFLSPQDNNRLTKCLLDSVKASR